MNNKLSNFLKNHILVLDGAMGTMIQNLSLTENAYGGESFQMLSDLLVFSRPHDIKQIHQEYLKAGAHAIETNTFGSSILRLQEYNFSTLDLTDFKAWPVNLDPATVTYQELCYALNFQAAQVARDALNEYQTTSDYDGRQLFVFGSIGPSNLILTNTKADLKKGSYDQIYDNFYQQVTGLIDGGVDVLLFETQQDPLELKTAILGAKAAMLDKGVELPIIAQVTVDQFSKMQIFNTDIHAVLTTIQHLGITAFGINCSIGPDLMAPTVKKLAQFSQLPISVIPNAGMPFSENGKTIFKLSPQKLANYLQDYVINYGINIVGGCCGTTPEHIKAVALAVKDLSPKKRQLDLTTYISGPQNAVKIDSSKNLIRIGERLNICGSKIVKNAILQETGIDHAILEEVILEQTRDLGLEIIDVCMDSNQVDTTKTLIEVIQKQTLDFHGAMCLDSFDAEALENAIKIYPGRPIINSISLEEYRDGLDKIDILVPVTQQHAPLYICLCAGANGPARTAIEKYQLAKQIFEKLTQKYMVLPEQILIDINAFPIGSEGKKGLNFAMESIQSIPAIKSLHPNLRTTIGVGNLTSGLAKKPYIRKVLTSVFLDEAYKQGLDAAIVNPQHYVPVENLPGDDYKIGLKIIQECDLEAFQKLEEIAERKTNIPVKNKSQIYDQLDPKKAICQKIIDGFKQKMEGSITIEKHAFNYHDAIIPQVAEVLKFIDPLEFINQYLMKSMEKLGIDFSSGTVSLPHLLKSADLTKEIMLFIEAWIKINAGVDLNEKQMSKGTIVLGTVYQDVHSIGKDLAKTLFENYGYQVIDLGVQVPLDDFITAAQEHQADAIGLSALLVQTSNHMITITEKANAAGLKHLPILIGGAPVNERHAAYVAMAGEQNIEQIRNNVFYCSSAMDGVNYMNAFLHQEQQSQLLLKNQQKLLDSYQQAQIKNSVSKKLSNITILNHFDYQAPTLIQFSAKDFLPYLNIDQLFHLNWKYGAPSTWEKQNISRSFLMEQCYQLIEKIDKESLMRISGIYGIFPCQKMDQHQLTIFDPKQPEQKIGILSFKADLDSIKKGAVGLQITTVCFKKEIDQSDFEKKWLLQGIADRIAEDLAEYIQHQIHNLLDQNQAFTSRRISPGYPSMTDLQNNRTIYDLLNVSQYLSVTLTTAHQFNPTSTTAAVVIKNSTL